MDALTELCKLLKQWEQEMTERYEDAERAQNEAKKRRDFYYQRMLTARNQLSSLESLRELMTAEGGNQ